MKVSTAVLAAGASIAAVGVAHLVQRRRQHKQRNDLALSLIQIEWLARASSDEKEAAYWAPEGVEPEQYQPLLSGNRMFCQLSLRFRLGLVTDRQLVLYADKLMESAAARAYWARFGEHREAEALGNETDEQFTRVMNEAFTRATMVA
ncbi:MULTISPECIES: DUF6082 family protein [Streptomyces]|uniref:DUF6082 family protein n=1 Tax=Streptomyces TaxID=1883 RepID=UPI00093C35E9|nr:MULTISPECIES: DUF6082 family protein [unclassified Streptomyces]OKJ09834.1 hypothetical protein AMK20_20360 [Streptomyces sp. TSRI0261]OWA26075.1 hypothetical protein B9W61_03300 [Streptomyces sp. CS057]QNQ32545.1 peptide transporter permease SapC [Streptomyces sp. CB00271]